MRLLLDTHAVIWHLTASPELSINAQTAILNAQNECFVSAASIWEIAIKINIGKITLDFAFEDIHFLLTEANNFKWLTVDFEHFQQYVNLPLHHRDPFDRILIAQSQVENLTIVSRDLNFPLYGVPILW